MPTSYDSAAIYATLRREGEYVLGVDMAREMQDSVTKTLRAKAKRDGLRVVASKMRPRHGRIRAHHPVAVSLALVDPANPTTIVRPDSGAAT